MKEKHQKNPISINIVYIGQLPFTINENLLTKHKSCLFKIGSFASISGKEISDYLKDLDSGKTSNDDIIDKIIMDKHRFRSENCIYFFITYIHLENDWYCRQANGFEQGIVFSFADIYDKLVNNNIPPENLLLSTMSAYSFCMLVNGKLPSEEDERNIMHRDTRGCIMDLCVKNDDAVFSADKPFLCSECTAKITKKLKPQDNLLEHDINKELHKIKKNVFVRIKDFIKSHILISVIFSLLISFMISALADKDLYSQPYNWKIHGVAIIACVLVLFWTIILMVRILIENHKAQKARESQHEKDSPELVTPKT